MRDLQGFGRTELTAWLHERNVSAYFADQIWQALYPATGMPVASIDEIAVKRSVKAVMDDLTLFRPKIVTQLLSLDGHTRKFLLELDDGHAIETVIMRYRNRYTACISTQVGCAMGCVFCATGQMGFKRHLSSAEIVAQLRFVQQTLAEQGETLRNVVLMGMGEPLHNYDATLNAVDIVTDHKGLAIAPKHITLSTVGVPKGIRRLADEQRAIKLAVSLHAATDTERQALIPVAQRWLLDDIMDACRYYATKRNRRVWFEWTLIEGKNDTPEQAHAVGQLLHDIEASVNLIPLNPTVGYAGRPSDNDRVRQFQAILRNYGLPSTVRQRRGIDIAAGCGQLQSLHSA